MPFLNVTRMSSTIQRQWREKCADVLATCAVCMDYGHHGSPHGLRNEIHIPSEVALERALLHS